MQRALIGVAILVAVIAGGAYFARDWLTQQLVIYNTRPSQPFDAQAAPPAPDYSNAESWAALPDLKDGADFSAPGRVEDRQSDAAADVFYLAPTTYYANKYWNPPLDEPASRDLLDNRVLIAQASAFNGCCRVYAPRYRQATFGSFFDDSGSGAKAIALAYKDIEAAFAYYLAHYNQGRPFILAGHSQGTIHLKKLLAEHVSGKPIAASVAAVYLVGFTYHADELAKLAPDFPPCATPSAIHCVISWNSIGPEAKPFPASEGSICINPLSFLPDTSPQPVSANLGGIFRGSIVDHAADGQCVNGLLLVRDVAPLVRSILDHSRSLLGHQIYHPYDYSLYYMNLRQNTVARVQAFFSTHPPIGLIDGPAPNARAAIPGKSAQP